jgi:hypothetical protein
VGPTQQNRGALKHRGQASVYTALHVHLCLSRRRYMGGEARLGVSYATDPAPRSAVRSSCKLRQIFPSCYLLLQCIVCAQLVSCRNHVAV